jgi:hypothetical protein
MGVHASWDVGLYYPLVWNTHFVCKSTQCQLNYGPISQLLVDPSRFDCEILQTQLHSAVPASHASDFFTLIDLIDQTAARGGYASAPHEHAEVSTRKPQRCRDDRPNLTVFAMFVGQSPEQSRAR